MDSKKYEELHGSNNWDGLLDPLDLDLRKLLLEYGELALVAEQAINGDDSSKYCGFSRYGKSCFFHDVKLPWAESKYQVTSFIYGTCKINFLLSFFFHGMSREGGEMESNWIGYVAVSKDEYSKVLGRREIVVVWRGTARAYEWIEDFLESSPVPAYPLLPAGDGATEQPEKVQNGLHTIYTTKDPDSEFVKSSARTQLLQHIKTLLNKYKDETVSITCTGHSLGACLSVLSAVDIAVNIAPPNINVSAFIFECPQVGNKEFKETLEQIRNLKILRVFNEPDVIPLWPTKMLKGLPVPTGLLDYVDVGIELLIDSRKSPYLKADLFGFHSLPPVLFTVSGWNGKDGTFDWGLLKRSLGGVNMQSDNLIEEFKIPICWWAQKNKGMVLNDNDDWVMPHIDYKDHDLPPH